MTQWFRGTIEGYYLGTPERAGSLGGAAYGRGYRLVVYRVAIRDVELLEWPPPTEPAVQPETEAEPKPEGLLPTTSDNSAPPETEQDEPVAKHLALPPWLPAPGTAFFQPTITDARLFPVRHVGGWYEGPVHQVFIEDFRSTHSKSHGTRVYGRFVGRVQAYFALPPPPLPDTAERLLQAFQDLPDDLPPPQTQPRSPVEPQRGATEPTEASIPADEAAPPQTGVTPRRGPAVLPQNVSEVVRESPPVANAKTANTSSAPAVRSAGERRVPFLILVILVGVALLLTCGAGRALLWILFLLPTLLVRRILRDLLPESTLVRGASALLASGQLWLTGMVFVRWWETGCRDVHPLPLLGTLVALFISTGLPSDIPFLINTSSLAALLLGWCTMKEDCHQSGASESSPSTSFVVLPAGNEACAPAACTPPAPPSAASTNHRETSTS